MSSPAGSPRRSRSGFTLVELLIVILIIGILMSLLLVGIFGAWRSSQLTMARQSLIDLTSIIHTCELEQGSLPPGDGSGSKELLKALKAPGPRHRPYYEPPADRIDAAGNLRSTLDPADIVRYRNNIGRRRAPEVHNVERFDLWFRDLDGHADGVNNW